MKKKVLASILACTLILSSFTACKNSGTSSVEKIEYDPVAELENFELREIPEADKDFKIEMGYNNCDHMVGAIIGEEAGIYDALDLNVNVTQTNNTNIAQAMSTNEMQVGYMGINGAIRSHNEGAPLFMSAANHIGGSRYLVASNDIKKPEDLIGKTLGISQDTANNPEWLQWAKELGIPAEAENYEIVEIAQKDGPLALKAGQIDAFACCDPFASQSELMEVGHIMAIGWGTDVEQAESNDAWGMCCIHAMNQNFEKEHPELAQRLMVAHILAVQYLYEHPYNAAMMFAEGFGTTPEVGILTVYMKTVAEGRTITWEFDEENLKNFVKEYEDWNVDPEKIPDLSKIESFMGKNMLEESNIMHFEDYLEESNLDEVFPLGMPFEDWLAKAKAIDGIDNEMGNDIKVPEIYQEQGYSAN